MKRPAIGLHRVALLHAFEPRGGFMYSVPILLDGDNSDEPLKSRLVLYEDGQPLRRAHEQHSIIRGTGRGGYSHWERLVYFSASDNSDPNKNGRTYSFAVDHAGPHEQMDEDHVSLHPPFYPQSGLCWSVAVQHEGDDVENSTISTLALFEDEVALGPPHTAHSDIEQDGSGAYSHWNRYLYFSTSDGSDPNTNGRLYTYVIKDQSEIPAD